MADMAILTDEQGNFVGEKNRYQLAQGDSIAIAGLFIENSRGEILISQRSIAKKNQPGLWGPSASGTLEPGETFEQNIIKEAEEEIGISGLIPTEIDRFHYWHQDGVGRYSVWYLALIDWDIKRFSLQTEEVADVRWISKSDLINEVEAQPDKFVGWPERWQRHIKIIEGLRKV